MPGPQSTIAFSIDHTPKLDGTGHSTLAGWALSSQGEIRITVLLRGEQVFESLCSIVRPDVLAAFPQSGFSMSCGFKVPLPQEILTLIPPGSLEVVASDRVSQVVVWRWNEGFQTNLPLEVLTRAKAYFKQQPQFLSSRRVASKGSSGSLVVCINTSGRHSRFYSIIEKVSALPSINRVLVSVAEGYDEVKYRKIVSEKAPAITSKAEFINSSTESTYCLKRCHEDEIVLYLDDRFDLTWIDLVQFVSDFRNNESVSLLMPTEYGSKRAVSIPQGMSLWDLRKKTQVHGVDVPRLFPTTALGPIWITSLQLLRSIAVSLPSQGESLSLSQVLQRVTSILFYRDLRQPVLNSADTSSLVLTHEPQLAESAEVALKPVTNLNKLAVFVVPEPWQGGDGGSGRQFQALSLMRRAVREGYDVAVVCDGDLAPGIGFGEFALWSLEDFTRACSSVSDGYVVACRWDVLRAAFILEYQLGLSVSCLIQEDQRLAFNTWQCDKRSQVEWAYRSEFLPIFFDPVVRNRVSPELVGSTEALVLPREFNRKEFCLDVSMRERNNVLVVFDKENVFSESRGEFLTKLVGELTAGKWSVTLVGYDAKDSTLRHLLPLVTCALLEPSSAERAQLYLEAQAAVFVDPAFGVQPGILEASACGCWPIVTAAQLFDDFASRSEICVAVEARVESIIAACSEVRARSSCALPEALEQNSSVASRNQATLAEMVRTASASMSKRLARERSQRKAVSIIVPVYNALDITIACVRSVLKYRDSDVHLVLVNDASDQGTTSWLRSVASTHERVILVDLTKNGGFVQACHAGLAACDASHDIVLLNSDVIITSETITRVRNAAYSRPRIGLVSALSTNSPHLKVPINIGDSLERAAKKIASLLKPSYPTIITPEGQLLYIRRWALDRFGFFDPVYNRGFCEESDMCMRMFLGGVDMVCADDAYIFHKKSASFGEDESTLLKSTNRPIFDGRWGRYYTLAYQTFTERAPIEPIRRAYAALEPRVESPTEPFTLREEHRNFSNLGHAIHKTRGSQSVLKDAEVVFVLPSAMFGGGSLSVLQHVNELLLRGIDARVISLKEPQLRNYPLLAPVIPVSVNQLFELDWTSQIVIATFWSTAYLVRGLTYRYPSLRSYYYVQDYEPWFYSRPDDFHSVNHARESYTLGLRGVAKTEFLRDTVRKEHGVEVELISPGIDRGTFYPGVQHDHVGRPRLAALYRPRTKRRGNQEALALIRDLLKRMPEVEVTLFGSKEDAPEDLMTKVNFVGELTPSQVAELYRCTDVVMDLSYWHGFGRMGLEGMACGAVPLLSQSGGVLRYAADGENAFVVDVDNLPTALEKLIFLLADSDQRLQMRARALATAATFSEQRATDDWLKLWKNELKEVRVENLNVPLPIAPELGQLAAQASSG